MTKSILLILLAALPTISEASVMCGVFEGSRCDKPLYYMKLCADITFRQKYCERLCARQEPICSVEDFSPWVQAYEDIGRRGIRGELQNYANEFDDAGTLLYLSQKTVTVCTRSLFGWVPFKPPKVCPKAGAATNSTCTAGTVLSPTSGTCVVQDSSGGSGTQDFQSMMNQSGMLVATQNQHFGHNPSTDIDATASAVTANDTPGLTDQTNVPSSAGNILSSLPAAPFKSSNSKGGSKGFESSGASVPSGSDVASTGSVKNKGNSDQVYASADTAAKDSYRAGGGGGAAGSAGSGTSWFGSGAAGASVTAGSSSGEVGFNGKASRGLASSSDVLNVEDPANYFMMSDIDVSLFKRVTAQCRRKEKELN